MNIIDKHYSLIMVRGTFVNCLYQLLGVTYPKSILDHFAHLMDMSKVTQQTSVVCSNICQHISVNRVFESVVARKFQPQGCRPTYLANLQALPSINPRDDDDDSYYNNNNNNNNNNCVFINRRL
jgi:hypothetical protein